MQGKITKVLNMKPKEILALIEEAAGTRMFEDRRQKAEKTMLKKDTKLIEIKDILTEEVEPKLRRFQQDKEIYLQFQDIQTELEKLQQIIAAHDYTISNYQFNINKKTIEQEKNKIKALEAANKELIENMKILDNDLNKIKIEKDKLDKDTSSSGKDNTKKLTELNNEIFTLNATKEIQTKNLNDDMKKIKALETKTNNMEEELLQKIEKLDIEKVKLSKSNEVFKALKNNLTNNNELLASLKTSGTSPTGYVNQINKFKKQTSEHTLSIKKNEMKINSNSMELSKNIDQMKQSENMTRNIEHQLEQLVKEKDLLNSNLSKFPYDEKLHQDLKNQEQKLRQELRRLNQEVESWRRRLYNIDFQYDKENVSFNLDSVKGVAATLFNITPEHLNKAQALQVCAGGRLFNIVVDNEKTGSELLERGNLKKRVTIIPLNKISSRKLRDDVLKMAKNVSGASDKVDLALNLIGYESDVAKAMEFIFGSSLICENADIAKKVTFHPQIRTKSITLEGDVYDPEGTLSGGSRNNSSNILVEIQDFNKLIKKQKNLENELKSISQQYQQLESIRLKISPIVQELTLTENKISQLQNEIKNSLKSILMSRNLELEEENKLLEEENENFKIILDQLVSDIKRTELDLKDFNQNKGANLSKLEKEIEELNRQVMSKEDETDRISERFEDMQVEKDQLEEDISNNKQLTIDTQATIKETQSLLEKVTVSINTTEEEIIKIKELVNSKNKESDLINREFNKLSTLIKAKKLDLDKFPGRLQKSQEQITNLVSANRELDSFITCLVEEFEWVEKDPSRVAQLINESEDLDLIEAKEHLTKLKESNNALKNRVNPNVISMIESVLKREAALRTMITTIEGDKKKIQDTIETLNQHKIDTLLETYEKVTVDFGNIFKELLPNSFAKLVILPNKLITDGLEVKVKLGSIWKESLVELSGGQRSLVALSLILALLQFKPAPMYILDEVDAALDLSHTQNIGHLIKTRFKGSQFIVVSLKEGMFTNANRVFRTRFQDVEELIIDGFKSYATRTVVSHWDPQFNAITGLNGSGKSNILDAICFVLGIASMATVRASNLQDLIYKRGQAGVTKASVTIVFNNSQRENSPIGFENIPKISVTRQITLGGTSKYLINGHRAQQQS
ncbi:hypothetical protein HANVADRAFT_4053, partial [Hanseniaspora valbyensis NRRL Y-1626]